MSEYITIKRTELKQALECLRGVARGKYDGNAAGVCAALEAALAQQAELPTIERLRDALVASRIIPPAFASLQDFEAAKAVLHDNLRAALAQQAEPAAEQKRKDGNYKVLYRCQDCGHDQWITEIVAHGATYIGGSANWCDACDDGLPVRVERAR